MTMVNFLQHIDTEIRKHQDAIAKLQQARALLAGGKPVERKKRHLSADARARIAAAQKRRWAKQKKAAQ